MEEARRMFSNDESPLSDTEVYYLRSEHVGDEFKILVGHCGSPESATPPVPTFACYDVVRAG